MTEELKQVSGEAEGLVAAEDSAQAVSTPVTGGAGDESLLGQAVRLITPPPAGETSVVRLSPGERFELAANPADVNLTINGNNLVLGFDLDGNGTPDSFVVLEDLVLIAGGGNPPQLVVAGEPIGADLLVGNALALAGGEPGGPGAPLEVAAGPEALSSGVSSYSDNLGESINLLVAQGVIPPVELEFRLIELEDQLLIPEEEEAVTPNTPPEADPVLTPAERGERPTELEDALADVGFPDVAGIIYFKQFDVDGEIGDDDTGVIADFGGADAETSLENLVFTLLSNPNYGQLILVTAGGDTSFLTPGDTFSSEDTVWWVATRDQINAFLEENSLQILPDATFDYSVTDEDGASATATVIITQNDFPTAGTAEIAIDEDGDDPDSGLPGLPGGLEGGPGDLAGVGTTESGILDYDFGFDGPGDVSFAALHGTGVEDENGVPVTAGGQALTWDWDDATHTLTALNEDLDPVLTLEIVDILTGEYKVSVLMPFDHPDTSTEDNIVFDLEFEVTDGNGDSVNGSVKVTLNDDSPVDITPQQALIGSGAGSVFSGDLDFFDNVGADRDGDVTFADGLHGEQLMSNGTPVTSGGKNIYLQVSNDGHTLTGYADSDDSGGFTPGDEPVFEINLNPDAGNQSNDLYTMEVFGDGFDTGAGETFDDFSQAPSGNTLWTGILGNEVDILLTAGDVNGDKANTSNVGFGVGNNLVGAGQVARVDFVTDLDLDPSDNGVNANTFFGSTDYIDFTQHVTVDAGRVRIGGITGGGTVDVKITAFDADDDPAPDRTDAADYQDDPIDPIIHTDIVVLDQNGDPVAVTYITEGDPVPAGVVVQGNADGSVTVYNMDNGWVVSNINTADGFNRLEIENVDTGGQSFRVTEVTFSTIASGDPIDLSFPVDVVDGDGDMAEGTIDVTVLPQIVGTEGDDAMTAGPSGSNLVGGAGDDTLIGSDETDLLQGGAGDDLIYGGAGNDVIEDGSGNDTIFSGDGADLINLVDDGETDVLVYTALSEAGDTVTGFDVAAPNTGAAGGDVIDIAEVLAGGDFAGSTLQDAIDDGYVTLIDNGGNAEVWVDLDGTAGVAESPVLLVTLNGVDIGNLNDNNVIVD